MKCTYTINDVLRLMDKLKSCVSFFVLIITSTMSLAQQPYLIESQDMNGNADTIWVLFPDIAHAIEVDSVPVFNANLLYPRSITVGDTIVLDSTYDLNLYVKEITWTADSAKCKVLGTLPSRMDQTMTLDYWWFLGGYWNIEGKSGYEPIACDHLQITMRDKDVLSVRLSQSRNCVGVRVNTVTDQFKR